MEAIGLCARPPDRRNAFRQSFHDTVGKMMGDRASHEQMDEVYGLLLDSMSRAILWRTLRKDIRTVRMAISLVRYPSLLVAMSVLQQLLC